MIVPASYYYQPTPQDIQEDPGWVTGYQMCEQLGTQGRIPDPEPADTYSGYRNRVYNAFGKSPFSGSVIDLNVGWDDALADGAEYNWVNSPTSPHNVAS